MAFALSRGARALITRRLAGERVALTDENRVFYADLWRDGWVHPESTRLTPAARTRQREFVPQDGPLSSEALELLERGSDGEGAVNDANRPAYRELAARGFMIAGHSFAQGDESLYRFTREGWEKRQALLSEPSHAESA